MSHYLGQINMSVDSRQKAIKHFLSGLLPLSNDAEATRSAPSAIWNIYGIAFSGIFGFKIVFILNDTAVVRAMSQEGYLLLMTTSSSQWVQLTAIFGPGSKILLSVTKTSSLRIT